MQADVRAKRDGDSCAAASRPAGSARFRADVEAGMDVWVAAKHEHTRKRAKHDPRPEPALSLVSSLSPSVPSKVLKVIIDTADDDFFRVECLTMAGDGFEVQVDRGDRFGDLFGALRQR
eukprot:7481814-Pyramimonas_sp.AAC.1